MPFMQLDGDYNLDELIKENEKLIKELEEEKREKEKDDSAH
ncbi:hypothetical protein V2W23_01990 [Staphylococcus gallinarum]|nr:hypothetical protein [Staphylococcus gallinarum]